MVEDRLVGIKSREIYEAPAALAIIAAHRELETLTLTRDVLRFKATVEQRYAELTYEGLWFTPLKSALDAFVAETQKTVTGTVRLKLYKGNSTVVGRKAPNALYSEDLATYDPNSTFDEAAAAGFIALLGPLSPPVGKRQRRYRIQSGIPTTLNAQSIPQSKIDQFAAHLAQKNASQPVI